MKQQGQRLTTFLFSEELFFQGNKEGTAWFKSKTTESSAKYHIVFAPFKIQHRLTTQKITNMMNARQPLTDTEDLSDRRAHTSARLSAVQTGLLEAGYQSNTRRAKL